MKKRLKSPHIYSYHPSHTVVNDFSEFSGLSPKEIERRINSFMNLTKKEWHMVWGVTFEEKAKQFYSSSLDYVFDLLSLNYDKKAAIDKLNGFTPRILDSIAQR